MSRRRWVKEGLWRRVMRWWFAGLFKSWFWIRGEVKMDPDLERAVGLYGGEGFEEVFSRVKAWDASFEEVEKLVPKKGVIVDLGCGEGLLANFLALSSRLREVVGMEVNKERVLKADRGVEGTSFVVGDVLKKKIPKGDAILLVHVLHHLNSYKEQEKLVVRCVQKLDRGGRLILVEIGEWPVLKYMLTWFTDAVVYPLLLEKPSLGRKFYYRRVSEWVKMLVEQGLKVRSREAHRGKPFSNVIIWGEKR